jgi:hypothetical protein
MDSYLKKRKTMKKFKMTNFLLVGTILILGSSCSIHSTTAIKSKEQFLLGNNPHRPFRVKLKNISGSEVEVHRAPIDGGRHSGQVVASGETIRVRVESNTALVISNNTAAEVSVQLTVRGDTGLSMGYAKK